MEEKKESILPLLFAIFGFMLIIATGVDMLLGNNKIPIIVSIIGLFLIIIAMTFRKREG
jgi:small neutral amino acid transporter SnatA (MarC family)